MGRVVRAVLLVLVLGVGCVATPTSPPGPTVTVVSPVATVTGVPSPRPTPTPPGGLFFGVLVDARMVEWFNQVAEADDLATVKAVGVGLLPEVRAGRRQVVFASAAEAEMVVPGIAGGFEVLGYDLEHWPQTPEEEKADPVGAVRRMRELADRYELELAVGPDRRFAEGYGVEMAGYVDRFVVQLQRAQEDPEAAVGYARPLIRALREVNPGLKVSVVVRLEEGNREALVELVGLLREDIDGVSILSGVGTGEVEVFVEGIRFR